MDKVNEFIQKANSNTLSAAEVVMLKGLDLAELHRFEQARDLSISLLKQWLIAYKFKNWTNHRTTSPGDAVSDTEKEARAEQIARQLSNNNHWHSHGRMISMKRLQNELKLEIDDYTDIAVLRDNVKIYNTLLSEYLERQSSPMIIHSPRG